MKKIYKVLVLVFAVAMAIGMSSMAAQLYLSEDYNYGSFADWNSANGVIDSSLATTSGIRGEFTEFNFSAIRSAGVKSAMAFNYLINANTTSIIENSNGNKMISATNTSYDMSLGFFPSKSWNAVSNPNEKYIISFDATAPAGGPSSLRSRQWIAGTNGSTSGSMLVSVMSTNNADNIYVTTSGTYSGYTIPFDGEKATRLAHTFHYDTETSKVIKGIADAGVFKESGTFGTDGLTSIDAFIYGLHNSGPRVAKLRMYTINTLEGFKVKSDVDSKVVPVNTDKVTLKFTHPVYEYGFKTDYITVKAGGENLDGVTFGELETDVVDGEYVSYVDVNLPELKEFTTYEITVNNTVVNEIGDTLVKNKITFSTPEPDLYVPSYKIIKGVGEDAKEFSAFVADAGLYTLDTTIKNTTSSAKEVTVVYGIYDSADKLYDTVYASKSVGAESSEVIGTGLTIPTSLSGGKIRVFLWNSAAALQPYCAPIEFDVEDSADETVIIDAAIADPELELSALTLKKGFFGDVDITKLSEAVGSTINVSTTVTGSTTGTVMFGVYKNDVLVNIAYVNKTFSDTDTVSVNIMMPSASDTDTIKLKAFVCKSVTDLTPFGTAIELSTND